MNDVVVCFMLLSFFLVFWYAENNLIHILIRFVLVFSFEIPMYECLNVFFFLPPRKASFLFYVNFVCMQHHPKIRIYDEYIFFAAAMLDSFFPKDNEQFHCLKSLFFLSLSFWLQEH